ncbi:3'(2'),5'-bisphosphate nucleotidase [Terasakiispira papahanaumokuakeensis]|uniref:3'(2'),5'-bisphosphate nucleotidase CysQ n=2 Tax=Terasakiispira papahanaumokuakeensis TaxID=197479 RepID=A0A1E2V6N1_9GAMM|nr:3'(2'),5'-bisphosphate nucleotidase [Terasakiispira papahanaumokuakeensis]
MVLEHPSRMARELGRICRDASAAIMKVYNQPQQQWDVKTKADDSPVTAADLGAHKVIMRGLSQMMPRLPVLSEESANVAWSARSQWGRYWLVDPLDGTREFLDRNDEFTINIAMIEHGQPLFGMVHVPVTGVTYYGGRSCGSYRQGLEGEPERLEVRSLRLPQIDVVASHRHGNEQIQPLLDAMQQQGMNVARRQIGSSLKLCMIAEGQADFYPRIGPTCEWDTAAAQAVIEGAGGKVLDLNFKTLAYNQKDSLMNAWFMVLGDLHHPWQNWLTPALEQLRLDEQEAAEADS